MTRLITCRTPSTWWRSWHSLRMMHKSFAADSLRKEYFRGIQILQESKEQKFRALKLVNLPTRNGHFWTIQFALGDKTIPNFNSSSAFSLLKISNHYSYHPKKNYKAWLKMGESFKQATTHWTKVFRSGVFKCFSFHAANLIPLKREAHIRD